MFGRLVVSVALWLLAGGRGEDSDAELVEQLRNDANLDLSRDEEYEDLRAELLAYRTALASLSSRRAMFHTACWEMGGVCMHWALCKGGANFRTQVPGCKDKLNVCCFAWNRILVKDMRAHGIQNPAFPWTLQNTPFGGKGIIDAKDKESRNNPRHKRGKKTSLKHNRTKLTIVVEPNSGVGEDDGDDDDNDNEE